MTEHTELLRTCGNGITICTPLSALLPVHVDRGGPVGVEAEYGGDVTLHVIPHHNGRRLNDLVDLPEDELHVLVASQGETEAVELEPVGALFLLACLTARGEQATEMKPSKKSKLLNFWFKREKEIQDGNNVYGS